MEDDSTMGNETETRAERRRRAARMKRRRRKRIIALLLLVAGLWTALYPSIAQSVNDASFQEAVQEAQTRSAKVSDAKSDAMLAAAIAYNRRLAAGDVSVGDRYEETLDLGGGLIGTIDIPQIGVSLPIFHGTSDETLLKGAGHIATSSFPVGGASTHAAISGHAGLAEKRMFTDLGRMKEGETFTITVLGRRLTYKVVEIKRVLPTETSVLNIEEGRDLVSLITCTPTGISTHRLVITGERVPDDSDENEGGQTGPVKQSTVKSFPVPMPVVIGSLLTLALITAYLVIVLRERKREKAEHLAPARL